VVLRGHSAAVRCVNFSSDGGLLMTASDDKTLKVEIACYMQLNSCIKMDWNLCSIFLVNLPVLRKGMFVIICQDHRLGVGASSSIC
jgi:WD40 repeat protein